MRKSKTLALALALCMMLVMIAACGGSDAPSAPAADAPAADAPAADAPAADAPAGDTPAGGGVVITLWNNKVEIDEFLKDIAAIYEANTGVKVDVKTAGGDTSYSVAFKADMQAGNEPEIFVCEGESGFIDYEDRLTDLGDQPWVSDTSVAYVHNGKVVGFPVAVEGYGLAYNKDILDAAGIDPATLTNFAAVKAAFETLDAKKGELGIDAVISIPAGSGMTWVTGLHSWNTYLTNGLAYDDTSVALKMMNGEVDTPRLEAYARYVKLMFDYAEQRVLLTGSYDDQINAFADGRTAFIHQGNWADPNLADAGVTFPAAYAPHPFLDTDTDGIFVAPPSWYVVNSMAPNPDAAKDFLTFLATTPEGHDYMVNKAGMVPAFDSVTLTPSGPLSSSVMHWANEGKIYSWQQYRMPDGFGMDVLGAIYTQLANGEIDEAGFVTRITEAIATLG